MGENEPGSGLANCTFNWDHADVVHARFHPYASEGMAWTLHWHSIQTECEQFMDAHDRALFEKYYEPFVRHDRTFIFHHLPKKRLIGLSSAGERILPRKGALLDQVTPKRRDLAGSAG
jgi:hypothetical protein